MMPRDCGIRVKGVEVMKRLWQWLNREPSKWTIIDQREIYKRGRYTYDEKPFVIGTVYLLQDQYGRLKTKTMRIDR